MDVLSVRLYDHDLCSKLFSSSGSNVFMLFFSDAEKTRKLSKETIAKLRADIANMKVEARSAEMLYENKLKEKQL